MVMFLARIDGTLTSTVKHATLEACRLLIGAAARGRRPRERASRSCWSTRSGAGRGSTVLVSTDGDLAPPAAWGTPSPRRLVVVGIVDEVHAGGGGGSMRLGIVRGHVVLHDGRSRRSTARRLLIVEPGHRGEPRGRDGQGGGKALVVADHLAPADRPDGGLRGGREAANPYWPEKAPVDAYCSLIVDTTRLPTAGRDGQIWK